MMSTVLGLVLLAAHPLGNFTVNQYAGVRVAADAVTVDYVLDMAELAAYQTRGEIRDEGAWVARACADVAEATSIDVDGVAARIEVTSARVTFPSGQAGLVTLRLECGLRAPATVARETTVRYRSGAYADRAGWREVTALGDGVSIVDSTVPGESVSRRLTAYPDGALDAPPDVTSAALRVRPGGPSLVDPPRAGAAARGADRLTAAFVSFVGRPDLTLGLGLVALLLALLLGALHAFAPGHGKTVLAAYLVAERGSLRHALAVAGTVTLTHTAGVLVLGVVLATSLRFAPERLYGWLGAASGLLLAGVGATMLRRARRSKRHHHHHHRVRLRGLLTMGFAGGLAPSPSAVVVLLGAVALGRTWFGVLMVLGYGLGMAAALAALGAVLARWRGVFERRAAGRTAGLVGRAMPVVAAALVLVVGLSLAARAAISLALA